MTSTTTDPDRTHPNLILAVLALGGLAYAMLSSAVLPALPTFQHALHASVTGVTWLLTAYLLAASVGTAILGRLGDMYGKEKILLWTLVILAAGTLISALSSSLAVIVVGRFIQGAAGGIFPLAFGIVRDEFPREKVAGSIGLLSAILGAGGGVGIVLAGLIIEHLNYHWLFWLPLIPTVFAALATWRFIPESPVKLPGRVNWLAAALMTDRHVDRVDCDQQTTTWGWGSAKTLGLIAVGLAVSVAWIAVEVRSKQPAGRHDDDADPRRMDDQRLRVPARRRDVRVVHRHSPDRPAAEEHRLRFWRLGRHIGPVPAADDDRDDDPRPLRRAASLPASARAARCWRAPRSAPHRLRCSRSRTAIPTTC